MVNQIWVRWKTGDNKWQEFRSQSLAIKHYKDKGITPALSGVHIKQLIDGSGSDNLKKTWEVSTTDPSVSSATQQFQEMAVSTAAQAAAPARATPAPAPAPAAPAPPPPAPQTITVTDDEMCLIIEKPDGFEIWTFMDVWKWTLDLLAASRDLLKTVPQGTVFEVVVVEYLKVIHERTATVELVGASTSGGQGDDGKDIEIQQNVHTRSTVNQIMDCKNYSRNTKGTRPNVRSVIGALMTSDITAGTNIQQGIGTLLVTSGFTRGAKECMETFNRKQQAARSGYSVQCWTFEGKFKDDMDVHFSEIRPPAAANDAAHKLLKNIIKGLKSRELISYK